MAINKTVSDNWDPRRYRPRPRASTVAKNPKATNYHPERYRAQSPQARQMAWEMKNLYGRPGSPIISMSDGSLVRNPTYGMRPGRSYAPSRPPSVVQLTLGEGRYSNPWAGTRPVTPGQWQNADDGWFKKPTGSVPFTDQQLSKAMAIAARLAPWARRTNPWLNAADLAMAILNMVTDGKLNVGTTLPYYFAPSVAVPAGLVLLNECSPGDLVVIQAKGSIQMMPCTITAGESSSRPDAVAWWLYGKLGIVPPYNSITHISPRRAIARPLVPTQLPNGQIVMRPDMTIPQPRQIRVAVPTRPPLTIPFALQPLQPVNAGNEMRSPGRSVSNGPKSNGGDRPPWWPPGVPMPPNKPSVPPGPGVKERKALARQAIAKGFHAAFEATEAMDLIDALYDALPSSVRAKTPKNGVTSETAFRPGVKYSNHMDKAKHLYDNFDKLDMSAAVINVLMNHYGDEVMGRLQGNLGRKLKRAKANGYGLLF